MCGIFGSLGPQEAFHESILPHAICSLAHRGPDDSGIFLSTEDGVSIGLAHTRLSIIDLSPLGHQPMKDAESGNCIVYNGEIYNFRELRRELEKTGRTFTSQSDTEVILAAYQRWGEECFGRLRGMFALALWDRGRKRLLLARDPMGIKPLYYYHAENKFLFASEVRTLLESGAVPRKLDSNGIVSYLAFGAVCEPSTMVEGIVAVPPGNVVTLEKGAVRARRYWSPLDDLDHDHGPRELWEKRLPEILRDAVLSHMVSDVPVGVFLSGGIDSSSLVAVLSHAGVRASTFSLVFREQEFDEAQYSREVARRFGSDHHEILVSQNDMLAAMPDALRAMDQPTIDGINTYLVSAKTRAAGVKVALTGLGADEMFAGYSNFRRVPQMEKLARRFQRLPAKARRPLAAGVALLTKTSDRNRKFAELARETSVHPYFLARMLFTPDERKLLFSAGYNFAERALEVQLQESVAAGESLDPVNRVGYLESSWYMKNMLLRDSDFMSMRHGLELRVPFLDRALVEACFRIPGRHKVRGKRPKELLLNSLGVELPAEIVNRPKRGFTLPFEQWLRGEMRPGVEGSLLGAKHDAAPLDPEAVARTWGRFLAGETSWSRPWSLFVLKSWCEQNM